jgi:phage shock protein A
LLNRISTFGYQAVAVRATVTANVAAGGFTPRMGILDRVSTLLRANINDMIDRAEDPEKVVKQLIIDMNNQLLQVKTQVAASIADEKLLYQRYQDNAEKATDWQQRAELAVEKGQDDMAREALSRRNSFQQTADGFKEQYDQQATQVESLKTALHQLEAKIQDASTKEELLIARARRAKAETNIRTTLSGLDNSSALASFSRIEEKVNQQEARAAALGELDADTTEHRFALMEQESEVDKQLAALKEKKGLAAPAEETDKALGPGKSAAP